MRVDDFSSVALPWFVIYSRLQYNWKFLPALRRFANYYGDPNDADRI